MFPQICTVPATTLGHAFNPNSREAEAGSLWVPEHPDYVERFCLKQTKKEQIVANF